MASLPQVGLEAVIGGLSQFQSGAKAITNAYDDIDKKSNTVAGSTVALGSGLLKLGSIAAGATLAGIVALGSALGGFAVTGISKAIDLDQRMANIAATAGVTKEQVGGLKDLIFDLSLNPNLVVNTNQAADAIEVLLANGAKLTDEFGNVTKAGEELATQVVAMSNATGSDFALSASIATDATNVFGLATEDLSKIVDGATGVMIASKFGAEDYALALAQAGGVAGQTGVEIEDFNTFIAGTASFFSSGSDAGTSFKTFLNQLTPSTNSAVDAMRELGLFTGLSGKEFDKTQEKIAKIDDRIAKLDPTSKNYGKRVAELREEQGRLKDSLVQGQNAFFNLDGSMKSGAEITGVLHDALAGLTEIQRAEALETIFGADASRTAAAIAGMTAEEFENLGKQVNKEGQALKAAATRVDSLSGAWEILQGVVEAIQIQVGDKFLPLLRRITVAFIDLASENGPMVVDFFGMIATAIDGFITLAGDTIGKVKELFAVFQAGGLFGSRSGSFGSIGLLAALGISPEIIGIIQGIFNQISSTVNNFMTLMETGIGTGFSLAVALGFDLATAFQIQDILNTIGTVLTNFVTGIIPFVIENFDSFKGAILGIGAALGGAAIAAIIAGIAGAIFALATPVTAIIAGAALLGAAWGGNWFGIRDITAQVWGVVQPILIQLGTWLTTNLPIAIQFLSTLWTTTLLPAMTAVWQFVSGTMFPLWLQLQGFLVNVVGFAITNLANQWTNILIPALTTVWNYISTNIIPLLVSIGEVVNAVVNKAIEASAGLWQQVLLPAVTAVWNWLSQNLMPILTSIGNYLSTTFGPMLGDTAGGFEGITEAIQATTSFFSNLADSIRNFKLPWFLTPGSPTPLETALEGISAVLSGPLKGAFDTFGKFGSASIKALGALLTGNLSPGLGIIETTVTRLFTVWEQLVGNVQSKIQSLMGFLTQMQSRAQTAGTSVITTFTNINSRVTSVNTTLSGTISKLNSIAASSISVANSTSTAITSLTNLGKVQFGSLNERLDTLRGKASSVGNAFEDARDEASGLKNVSFSSMQSALSAINSTINSIIESFKEMTEAANEAAEAAGDATESGAGGNNFAGAGGRAAIGAAAGVTGATVGTTPTRGGSGNVTNIYMTNQFGGNTLGNNMDLAQFDSMVQRSLQRLMR